MTSPQKIQAPDGTSIAGMGHSKHTKDRPILQVYIPHRPTMDSYQHLNHIQILKKGDIDKIIQTSGNHWRKIFVIFAKIASALDERQLPWKTYLQEHLLQATGSERLLFCETPITIDNDTNFIHLFSGKACGEIAGYNNHCHEIAAGFYQSQNGLAFITPYFDYRQLSNIKIDYLIAQIKALSATNHCK